MQNVTKHEKHPSTERGKKNQEKGMRCWYVSALIIGLFNDVVPTVAVI
jgi:hypothetical protein